MSAQPAFTVFLNLPPELQSFVWEQAFPGLGYGIIEVEILMEVRYIDRTTPEFFNPNISFEPSFACRRPRLRHDATLGLPNSMMRISKATRELTMIFKPEVLYLGRGERIYFHPIYDTIYLDDFSLYNLDRYMRTTRLKIYASQEIYHYTRTIQIGPYQAEEGAFQRLSSPELQSDSEEELPENQMIGFDQVQNLIIHFPHNSLHTIVSRPQFKLNTIYEGFINILSGPRAALGGVTRVTQIPPNEWTTLPLIDRSRSTLHPITRSIMAFMEYTLVLDGHSSGHFASHDESRNRHECPEFLRIHTTVEQAAREDVARFCKIIEIDKYTHTQDIDAS